MRWEFLKDNDPSEPGWYGLAWSWSVREGVFSGSAYWNGTTWRDYENLPFCFRTREAFPTREAASIWTGMHDPDAPGVRVWGGKEPVIA
jgi:hypothetical protein